MRGLLLGLALAVLVFAVTGGHLLFLPLFFVLPLGGLFSHRRYRRRSAFGPFGGRARRW